MLGIRSRKGQPIVLAQAKRTTRIGTTQGNAPDLIGYRLSATIPSDVADFGISLIVVEEENAATVSGELRRTYAAVEISCK